jgi:ABC-type Zn uptake system ZnuABC Zn-binding protein ZnuA
VRRRILRIILLNIALIHIAHISGCGPSGAPPSDDPSHVDNAAGGSETELSAVSLGPEERLNVVATTNIVGDIVQRIGGDDIELAVMIPVGVDPHAFVPTPRNLAQISDADVVFANGAGLEEFLGPLLTSADATLKVVYVSQGIELLSAPVGSNGEHQTDDDHGGADPHTWTDPNNVAIWADNIEHALSILDPEHAEGFRARAAALQTDLGDLDAWVRDEVAQIPQAARLMVTDHRQFAYFAERYGFEQVGTIIPGYSTTAEPSVKELADLEDTIRHLGVETLFVGKTVNPALAERVAHDTGTRVVLLYTGSLTEPGGDADTYVDYIRYNVSAIVNALK